MKNDKKTTKELELIASKVTHIDLKDIKETIGYGYAGQLIRYIKKKTGQVYSNGYIRNSLSMNHLNPSILIFAMALALEKEYDADEDLQKAKQFISNKSKNYVK